MPAKVLTFGELMMRLSPPSYERFFQSPRLEASFGGGEANVAVSLSRLGVDSGFVSALPAHALGDAAIAELRKHGVETSGIVREGQRIGIYYCEKGASQRASKVIYDRAHSAIAEIQMDSFDWPALFQGVEWFHFTGITPALGANVAEATLAACQAAKKAGVRVSCDLNYRKNLWTPDQARKTMETFMPYVELLIANEEDSEKVFGIRASDSDLEGGHLSSDGYVDVARRLMERFSFKEVAITLRKSYSASRNGWAGLLHTAQGTWFSREYDVQIVDRVGGGDSFAAGLILARLAGWDGQKSVEWAAAASCLKHSIEGDFNLATYDEIQSLVGGNASGRVQR